MKNVKKVSAPKKASTKKADLTKENVKKVEKEVAKKDNLYRFNYDLDTDQLKAKRQTARYRLNKFISDIINYSDLQKDKVKLEKSVKEFKSFYKETYLNNDFTPESLRGKMDDKERKDLERMLHIVKASKVKPANNTSTPSETKE